MELIVSLWIITLWSVALFNLGLLLKIVRQNKWTWSMNLVCASIYTFVCAFRSFFPRIDAERICFFDSLLSYPFIGRSFATIAEISFAYQVSRYWFELMMINDQKSVWMKKAIREFVFVVCTVAQGWCWMAVLTRNQFYHAIEESHWGTASAVLTLSTVYFKWGQFDRQLVVSCIGGMMYTLFMILIDVPMYVKKQNDIQLKVPVISVSDGFSDSLTCGIVSQKSEDWIDEMAWLTGYFSLGVWSSLYIASRSLENRLLKNK